MTIWLLSSGSVQHTTIAACCQKKKGGHARAKIWKHIFLCRCWLLTACQWIASHTPFQNDSKTLYYFHPFSMLTVLYSFAASLPPSQDGPAYLGSFPATCPQRCNNHSSLLKGRYLFILFFFSFFGPLVSCSSNPLVPWSSRHRHLVSLLSGPRCPGPLVFWSPGPLFLFRFFFSNLSFALFHYLFYIFTLSFVYVSFVSLVFVCVIFMLL